MSIVLFLDTPWLNNEAIPISNNVFHIRIEVSYLSNKTYVNLNYLAFIFKIAHTQVDQISCIAFFLFAQTSTEKMTSLEPQVGNTSHPKYLQHLIEI